MGLATVTRRNRHGRSTTRWTRGSFATGRTWVTYGTTPSARNSRSTRKVPEDSSACAVCLILAEQCHAIDPAQTCRRKDCAHRGGAEPQGKPRTDGPGHVREVRLSGYGRPSPTTSEVNRSRCRLSDCAQVFKSGRRRCCAYTQKCESTLAPACACAAHARIGAHAVRLGMHRRCASQRLAVHANALDLRKTTSPATYIV